MDVVFVSSSLVDKDLEAPGGRPILARSEGSYVCYTDVYKDGTGVVEFASSDDVVEDGYEFFAKRQLVTLFSAPNYCGEFDNAGSMMTVDETLMCSFQILKPADKKKFPYGTTGANRPITPPRTAQGAPPKKGKK
ncbi:hypothetical protein PRIPAC_85246 [Pristionchus pacificus]|uniref:protein-serine/threonine phosphatase n=1 Tax=Pristionchus pacificus TaxID=54126 RepID=A0A2A6BNH8_PRIPA|nr:hypothetical protein PRIPAC_85246 [Pristionchus pacificus]|eukprot:PDM67311.1 hypothetical protein PRIPAC_48728 [Pristionchus pacificus]